MSIFHESLYFTSLMAIVFIVFTVHLSYRTKQRLQNFYKQNNQLANNYIELQNNCQLLEQRQKEYLKASKTIVYDLRSPIAGIVSAAQLLLMDGTYSKEDEKLLSLIEE